MTYLPIPTTDLYISMNGKIVDSHGEVATTTYNKKELWDATWGDYLFNTSPTEKPTKTLYNLINNTMEAIQ